MSSRSAAHQLADHLLGDEGPLEDFVRSRRQAGRSWRLISIDLYEELDAAITLSPETLRGWFPDEPDEAAS